MAGVPIFFLDSGVGGRITVEKRGSNRVVLEGLWDFVFQSHLSFFFLESK